MASAICCSDAPSSHISEVSAFWTSFSCARKYFVHRSIDLVETASSLAISAIASPIVIVDAGGFNSRSVERLVPREAGLVSRLQDRIGISRHVYYRTSRVQKYQLMRSGLKGRCGDRTRACDQSCLFRRCQIATKKRLESLPRQRLVATLARVVDVQEDAAAVEFHRHFTRRAGTAKRVENHVARFARQRDATTGDFFREWSKMCAPKWLGCNRPDVPHVPLSVRPGILACRIFAVSGGIPVIPFALCKYVDQLRSVSWAIFHALRHGIRFYP